MLTGGLQVLALSLDVATDEYREAKQILKGGSLVEAARYYASKRMLNVPAKPVKEVVGEMIKAKRSEGCSERYIRASCWRTRRPTWCRS